MSSLFISGNGFDLAHGIPSKYSDFRNFMLKHHPELEYNRDICINLEDYIHMEDYEISAELLLHAMDKAAGETWADFEDALSRIDLNEKLPKRIYNENEPDEEDEADILSYLLHINPLSSLLVDDTEHWNDFFQSWIQSVEYNIENCSYLPKEYINNLFKTDSFIYFSFNYTKTLQKLYGVKKVTHIHNQVGQNLVFGHGRNNAIYDGEIFSTDLNKMIRSFRKDTYRQIKKHSCFFENLNSGVDKVYSYGFSYSSVDMVYIKKIISKISKNAIWYFTKFEAQNTDELRRRKIKLRRNGFKGVFGVFEG